jgi:anti-sigma factor ChrR (cupin superfamily)
VQQTLTGQQQAPAGQLATGGAQAWQPSSLQRMALTAMTWRTAMHQQQLLLQMERRRVMVRMARRQGTARRHRKQQQQEKRVESLLSSSSSEAGCLHSSEVRV